MPSYRTEVIRDAERLAAIERPWWSLWAMSPGATPFQSPAWLLPWWECFQPGPLVTVAVWQGEDMVGLAPLWFEDGAYGRRLLPLGIGISDHLDLLLAPAGGDVFADMLTALARVEFAWDSVELEELAPEAAALPVPLPPGFGEARSAQTACPGLALSGEVDISGLPVELSGKRRQTYRRYLGYAEAAGGLTMSEPGPQTFINALVQLHRARWEARGEAGVLSDERVVEFQRRAAPLLLERGLVRLFLAEIGGELAGAYYGLRWADRAGFYLSGFDPKFDRESPLSILIGHAFRCFVNDGVREFSFLRGQEPYKYLWGGVDRWNQRRSIWRAGA